MKIFDLFMPYEFRLSEIRMLIVHYVLVYIRPNGNISRKWPFEKLNNRSIIAFACLHCLKLTKLMKAYSVCYVSFLFRLLTPITCSERDRQQLVTLSIILVLLCFEASMACIE